MAEISAQQVAKLRAQTGVGMLAVKQALEEANGNEEKAIEILRKKGQAQAVKKSDRLQGEGGIFIATDGKKAGLVFLKCETDFVARSENFVKLGQELADLLLAKGEKEFQTIAQEKVPAAVMEFGENISIGEMKVLEAPVIGTYVHSNRKIGVVVGVAGGTTEKAVDAAMHAAAMNPEYVKPEQVPAEVIAKEKEIWKEQMKKESNKPAEIIEKIMLGKEKKFREENALIMQPFVKNPEMTVGTMLGADVTTYVRIAI